MVVDSLILLFVVFKSVVSEVTLAVLVIEPSGVENEILPLINTDFELFSLKFLKFDNLFPDF